MKKVTFKALGIESPIQYRTYSKLVKRGENVIDQLNDMGYFSITILKD